MSRLLKCGGKTVSWKRLKRIIGPMSWPGDMGFRSIKGASAQVAIKSSFPTKMHGVGERATFPGGRISKPKQCHKMGQLTNNCGCSPGVGLAFHKAVEKPLLDQASPRWRPGGFQPKNQEDKGIRGVLMSLIGKKDALSKARDENTIAGVTIFHHIP